MPVGNNSPSVAVIVTVCDRVQYLPEALQSVLAQSFRGRTELIVVDNGLQFSAREKYEDFFPTVRWVRHSDAGVCAARNVGTELSHGDYVTYLDDDDVWLPDRIETQFRFLESHPEVDATWCDMVRFTETSSDPSGYYERALDRMLDASHQALPGRPTAYLFPPGSLMDFAFDHDPLPIATMMVRPSFLKRIGGWDPTIHGPGDCHDLFLRLGYRGTLAYQNVCLVKYRRGHVHMTKGLMQSRVNESRALCQVVESYPADLRRAMRPGLLRYLARVGLVCTRSQRVGPLTRAFRQSVREGGLGPALSAWRSVYATRARHWAHRNLRREG